MRYLTQESGGFSDQHAWPAIRYLDPERNCQNASRPVLVPVIVFLTLWLIFLAAMYVLTVRVSHTGILPATSSLEKMKTDENRFISRLRANSLQPSAG